MGSYGKNYSRSILIRFVILTLLVGGLVVYGAIELRAIYWEDQLTTTGLLINGAILALFGLGMVKLFLILLRYQAEEGALAQFVSAIDAGESQPTDDLSPKRIICQRYEMVKKMNQRSVPIDQAALASMLLASESTRISLPKFVHNILILSGVFGTIVSLSIALVGASNLLENKEIFGNMGMVIHGMSTALSTTITAIISYVFFGYFYLKLTDAQTHLLSRVEEVTSVYLLPRYSHSEQSVIAEVGGLVRQLHNIVITMQSSQQEYAAAGRELYQAVDGFRQQLAPVAGEMERITRLLQLGFRLSESDLEALKRGDRPSC
ncbi:hypothetical protein D5085_17690 [Ectothiorhodospiraceae bacterium BW-2]|nr:hypothetical protein D5085_17690 [Ectothiorhodospiraceae bacterium BW-2]